jgi:hypothetical protein
MSSRSQYVPKHRSAYQPKHALIKPARQAQPARAAKVARTMLLSTLAVGATGAAVAGGVLGTESSFGLTGGEAAQSLGHSTSQPLTKRELRERGDLVSRSGDRRQATDAAKAAALDTTGGLGSTERETMNQSDPREIAKALLPTYGFALSQFSCLDSLYMSESGWRVNADNPTSSAYGIPQALTSGRDMPAGYFSSAEVQIKWGLEYIQDSYGSPCSAWSFKSSHGWY